LAPPVDVVVVAVFERGIAAARGRALAPRAVAPPPLAPCVGWRGANPCAGAVRIVSVSFTPNFSGRLPKKVQTPDASEQTPNKGRSVSWIPANPHQKQQIRNSPPGTRVIATSCFPRKPPPRSPKPTPRLGVVRAPAPAWCVSCRSSTYFRPWRPQVCPAEA